MLGVVNVNTPVPPVSGEPPVEAAYQSRVAPAEAVPERFTVPVPQMAAGVFPVTVGRGLIVTVTLPCGPQHPAGD